MWNARKAHAPESCHGRVRTVPNVYGTVSQQTEVPRTTLLAELKQHSDFHSTQGMSQLFQASHSL